MSKTIIGAALGLTYLGLIGGFAIGWMLNVYKLFTLPWDTVTVEIIIRLFGVPIAVVGAIAGWF